MRGTLTLGITGGQKREFGTLVGEDRSLSFFHINHLLNLTYISGVGDGAIFDYDTRPSRSTKRNAKPEAYNLRLFQASPNPVDLTNQPPANAQPQPANPATQPVSPFAGAFNAEMFAPPLTGPAHDAAGWDVFLRHTEPVYANDNVSFRVWIYVLYDEKLRNGVTVNLGKGSADELVENPTKNQTTRNKGRTYFDVSFDNPDGGMNFIVFLHTHPGSTPAEYGFPWNKDDNNLIVPMDGTFTVPIDNSSATPADAELVVDTEALATVVAEPARREPPEIKIHEIKLAPADRQLVITLEDEDSRGGVAGRMRFIPDGAIEFNGRIENAPFEESIEAARGLLARIKTFKYRTRIILQLIDWPDRTTPITIVGDRPEIDAQPGDGFFAHLADGWQGRVKGDDALVPFGRLLFGSAVMDLILLICFDGIPFAGRGSAAKIGIGVLLALPWTWLIGGILKSWDLGGKILHYPYSLFFKTNNRLLSWMWLAFWSFFFFSIFGSSSGAEESALDSFSSGSDAEENSSGWGGELKFVHFLVTLFYTPIAALDELYAAYVKVRDKFAERRGPGMKDSALENFLEKYFEHRDHSVPQAFRRTAAAAVPAVTGEAVETVVRHGGIGNSFFWNLLWQFGIEIFGQVLGARFLGH